MIDSQDEGSRGDSRFFRRLLIGISLGMCFLLFCTVLSIWNRGRIQQSRVTALLRYEASIEAQYGPYSYVDPPTMIGTYEGDESTEGGEFTIVLRLSSRAIGFSAVDEPPRFVEWLLPVFNEHCFTRVTDIAVHDERFSDADVELLLAFPELREIDLSDTAITDDGLARLASLKRLVMLNVSFTQVTAKSLRLLANCRELKELDLSGTNADEQLVTDLKRELPDCWIRL